MTSNAADKSASQPSEYQPSSGYPAGYNQPGHGQASTGYIQPGYGQPATVYGQPGGYGYPGAGNANSVVVQQPQAFGVQPAVRPPDHLILSIVSIFFCFPMGICAIVFSWNSKSSADAGDMASAESNGITARKISSAAISLGLLIITLAIVVPIILRAIAVARVSSCSSYPYKC